MPMAGVCTSAFARGGIQAIGIIDYYKKIEFQQKDLIHKQM
jgi:hypothetical protein